MSEAHKVIKYLAIAFAAFIIVSIVTITAYGVEALSYALGLDKDESIVENLTDLELSSENFAYLEIDLKATNLIITEGTRLRAETNNKNIYVKESSNKLRIEEKKKNWFSYNEGRELVIYVPQNMVFDVAEIDTGAGKNEISTLQAKKVSIELGAGKTTISNLVVTDEAEIDGGVGEVEISSGSIRNLDLNLGVGKFTLNAILFGISEIDAGVGDANINLLNSASNYQISAKKGIGTLVLNGKNLDENMTYGDGNAILRVEGGVGIIKITTVG